MAVGAYRPHIYIQLVESGRTLRSPVSQCCSRKISSHLLTAFHLGWPSHLLANLLFTDPDLRLFSLFHLLHQTFLILTIFLPFCFTPFLFFYLYLSPTLLLLPTFLFPFRSFPLFRLLMFPLLCLLICLFFLFPLFIHPPLLFLLLPFPLLYHPLLLFLPSPFLFHLLPCLFLGLLSEPCQLRLLFHKFGLRFGHPSFFHHKLVFKCQHGGLGKKEENSHSPMNVTYIPGHYISEASWDSSLRGRYG